MENHYNYLNCKNMKYKTKRLKQMLLTEIKNYKRKYTIYKLVCNITGNTYYGSTCQSLKKRLIQHESRRNCSSNIILDKGDYLPLIPLETNLSYGKKINREDWYILNNVCVNKQGAKRNVEKAKESKIKYGKNNKEKIKIKNDNWRKNNKDYDYWRRKSPIGILARSYFN